VPQQHTESRKKFAERRFIMKCCAGAATETREPLNELSRSLRVCYLAVSLALVGGSGFPAGAQESYTELFEQGLGEPGHPVVEAAEVARSEPAP
jgi:hypothetical protein